MKRSIGRAVIAAVAVSAAGLGVAASSGATPAAGSGGRLLLLQWQAPSLLNGYLSGGTKDLLAASLVLEPLAQFSPAGELVPVLAEEIPTLDNGGFAEDLTSITWKLKEGLRWSDGTPVTANDAVVTWRYATAEHAPVVVIEPFEAVREVVAVDEHTIRVDFDGPTPYPYTAFVSFLSPILQAAQFEASIGTEARSNTAANQYPIGTGPYAVVDFRPEDTAIYEINPNYRGIPEGRPFFGSVELKGGGDATAAARTVLEEGGADYAWNLLVAPEVLEQLAASGGGRIEVGFGANTEHLAINQADNRNPAARSEYAGGTNRHPFFHDDPELVRALSLAIDRHELVEVGYGTTGRPAVNVWNAPPAVSPNNDWGLTQDTDEANRILDALGYLDTDGNGIREKHGNELIVDFYTSTNAVRQDFQSLIQGYWTEIGIGVSLRNASASIFFGPATNGFSGLRFYADVQMYNYVPVVDPQQHFANYLLTSMPSESNGWSGGNVPRYHSETYEATYARLAATGDIDGRIALTIELNDILIDDGVIVPLVHRGRVSAFADDIQGVGELNGWDSEYWNIADWHRHG